MVRDRLVAMSGPPCHAHYGSKEDEAVASRWRTRRSRGEAPGKAAEAEY